MYSVILADDEPPVLRAMSALVNWKEFGFSLRATAENGARALALAEEIGPDLVITDVRMPGMDGIALAGAIREKWPDAEVVIISGYDDFEYAQSAMRLGVREYLLKPTDRGTLRETLGRTARRLESRKAYRREQRRLTEELARVTPYLRDKLLSEIAVGSTAWCEDVAARLRQYGCGALSGPFRLCCFAFEETASEDSEYPYWVSKTISETVALHLGGDAERFSTRGRLYLVCPVREEDDPDLLPARTDAALKECRERLGMAVFGAVSRQYASLADLRAAASDCRLALEHRGEKCVAFDGLRLVPVDAARAREVSDPIATHLRLLDAQGAKAELAALGARLREGRALYSHYYSAALKVLLELYNLCADLGLSPRAALDAMGRLQGMVSPDSLLECVEACIDLVLSEASSAMTNRDSRIVRQIREYVQANLVGDLSLAAIAQACHFSKNYLCGLFKRETGETLVRYVTRMRMDAAKALLKTTDMKNYEVAQAVGYSDYLYCSQVFRKATGATMGEYREAFGQDRDK